MFDDLLEQTGRMHSLDELLVLVPQKLKQGLGLSSVVIFLREKSHYTAQLTARSDELELSFAASSSTVSHLRRYRQTVLIDKAKPDAWLLLAAAEEIATLDRAQAQLLVPLEGRTGMTGFMAIAKASGKSFSSYERRSLRSLGVQMGVGFETARFIRSLSDEAAASAKHKKELDLAREVQERLLPGALPALQGLDVAAHYQSAGEIGGDYYDVFETRDGLICFVIGDISGKGVAAALLMATLRASLRSLLLQNYGPLPDIATSLNSLLYDASSACRYATLFFMLYDSKVNRVTYVNCGHNPPMLIRGVEISKLECGGPVVGLLQNVCYEQGFLELLDGDRILAYTDGVTEATNIEGEEWGEQRFADIILTAPPASASEAVARIISSLSTFTTDTQQGDDITLMIVQRNMPSRPEDDGPNN